MTRLSNIIRQTHPSLCRNLVQIPIVGIRNIIRQHTHSFVVFLFKVHSVDFASRFNKNIFNKTHFPTMGKINIFCHVIHASILQMQYVLFVQSPRGTMSHIFPTCRSSFPDGEPQLYISNSVSLTVARSYLTYFDKEKLNSSQKENALGLVLLTLL